MTLAQSLLPEFEQEMATTRKALERVPSDKNQWKPHEKSFSVGHLAQLLSWMPGWITNALRETELDIGTGGGYTNETTETLLATFDKNVTEARAALQAATDADFEVMWSLKMRGQVLFTAKRKVIVRQHISHLVHHRGQMSVYLRLLDIPVPQMYGPTADEKWG